MAKDINSLKLNKEVRSIFSKVNFLPEEIIFAEPRSPRLIIKGKIGREEVVFKSCENSRKIKSGNIIKEGRVGKVINQFHKREKVPSFEIIDFGKTKNISWLVRKYYHGGVLGANSNNFSDRLYIDRFTHLNKKYANQQKIFVKKIIDNLAALRHIDKKQVKFSSNNITIMRFADNFTNYQISKLSDCLELNLEIQQKFFQQNRKLLFSSENTAAAIGDMAPTNIFIDKNNKVIFFDLEWFCFDNYLVDITFFWLLLWRYPDWQKEIENVAIKTRKDELNFQLNVIRIVLTLFGLIFAGKNNQSNYFRQAEKLCQEHPWRKYLTVATEFYDALVK